MSNITNSSMAVRYAYGSVSGFIGFADLYLLSALTIYEIFYQNKPKGGKTLRLLSIATASVAIAHAILQQLILTFADRDDAYCFSLMLLKSTLLSVVVSLSYSFLWLRLHSIYSNPRLEHLWGRKMAIVKWITLGFIAANPILMFGFQFMGDWYKVIDGVCVVLRTNRSTEFVLGFLFFSYTVIQVALLFVYFYPLCKNGKTLNSSTKQRQNSYFAHSNIGRNSNRINASKISPRRRTVDENHLNPSKLVLSKPKKSNIEKSMKKWLIISCICIFTDAGSALVLTVFLAVVAPGSIVTIYFLWHDVSMVISVVCMTCCFGNFSKMLIPFLWLGKSQSQIEYV